MSGADPGRGEEEKEPFVREVRGKADRLARARRRRGGLWRHVAHVGSLGFVFVLPLVAGGLLGRAWAEHAGRPVLAIVMLGAGLGVGAGASWHLIRQSLREDDS